MKYYLKIEDPKKTENHVFLAGDYVKSLIIEFDSPDETEAKMEKIRTKIEISGKLDEKSQKYASIFCKWALLSSTDSSAYRKLSIFIIGEDDQVWQRLVFDKAFLLDYNENLKSDAGEFCLRLKQKTDKIASIDIDSSRYTFNPKDEGFTEEESDKK